MNIGKFRHKGYIVKNTYTTNNYGGQTLTATTKTPCYFSIIGSNGKESFQNDAIFDVKTVSLLVRVCDSQGVTASDRVELDDVEYNINDVELYEKDRGYNLLRCSRNLITGD